MNTKDKSLHKVLAAVVIALLLILTVGIAASGRQNGNNEENNGENDETINDADKNDGDTDSDGSAVDNITPDDDEKDEGDDIYIPKFVNYLTGLECPEEDAYKLPFAFVTEPSAPLYGISDSELTVEIPTDGGKTRFLIYKTDISELGKIGAMASTRDYINAVNDLFGGILAAYGNDDILTYQTIPSTLHLDLTKHPDACYKENGKNIYSDAKSMLSLIKSEGIDTESYKTHHIPYVFAEFGKSVSGNTPASSITLPYSEETKTVLTYNEITGTYLLSKADRGKIDMLTGDCAAYKNVIVLFADSITYEMSSGTQSVMQVEKRGAGYYITDGTLTEIRWRLDEKDRLVFEDLYANILAVNRGNTYIGYFKSSASDTVTFK